MSAQCPELEELFLSLETEEPEALAHLSACAACRAVVEEHRQMEKDLLRLADPLPPRDLVARVMARVNDAPVSLADEARRGVAILLSALGLAGALFVAGHGKVGALGASLANALVMTRPLFHTLAFTLTAASKAVTPLFAMALTGVLMVALFGLRRLAPEGGR
jgi:anti-sigma factor RsiW